MKVFLLKDIEKIGFAGEIVKVKEGFAKNFIIPRKLGIEVTQNNEPFYTQRSKKIDNRKSALDSKTSMLAEKIGSTTLVLHRKLHDDGKLYGSVSPADIVELLFQQGISVAKNQVTMPKSIKEKGLHKVTIKLSSQLRPQITVKVVSE
jgi:large subunit ribosomal protein L9